MPHRRLFLFAADAWRFGCQSPGQRTGGFSVSTAGRFGVGTPGSTRQQETGAQG